MLITWLARSRPRVPAQGVANKIFELPLGLREKQPKIFFSFHSVCLPAISGRLCVCGGGLCMHTLLFFLKQKSDLFVLFACLLSKVKEKRGME